MTNGLLAPSYDRPGRRAATYIPWMDSDGGGGVSVNCMYMHRHYIYSGYVCTSEASRLPEMKCLRHHQPRLVIRQRTCIICCIYIYIYIYIYGRCGQRYREAFIHVIPPLLFTNGREVAHACGSSLRLKERDQVGAPLASYRTQHNSRISSARVAILIYMLSRVHSMHASSSFYCIVMQEARHTTAAAEQL